MADIGRTLERVERRQDKQDDGQKLLAGLVEKLARAVTAAAQPTDDGLRPHSSWLLLDDPSAAVEGLTELAIWINQVYLQWPGTELPSCWLWHPWIIEELWTLYAAHVAAWHPDSGNVEKVSDFMERRRPGTAKRLSAAADCRLSHHKETGDLDRAPLLAPLNDSANRIAVSWIEYGHQHQQPYPTPPELTEAQTYEHQLNNTP